MKKIFLLAAAALTVAMVGGVAKAAPLTPSICSQISGCPGVRGPRGPAGPQGAVGPAGPADNIYFVTLREFWNCRQVLVERTDSIGAQSSLSPDDKNYLNSQGNDEPSTNGCYRVVGREGYSSYPPKLQCEGADLPAYLVDGWAWAGFGMEFKYYISGIARKRVTVLQVLEGQLPTGLVRKEILRVLPCVRFENAFRQPTPPATP